jgi:diguanylate cyclase (GGDEF)-like protein
MVIFMFGLFAAKPRQMAWASLYAVVVFGLAMAFMAWRLPLVYPPKVELGHFIMVATMLPAASMLAARISLMRQRMRAQRLELKQALARIEELATCDTLTGLLNRRHLLEVLERELQRSVRSGQAFCIAVLDLDGLRDVNRRHGIATGDQVLCAFAQEAQAAVRIVDRLGRYGGGTFVLLLCDTRAPLGRLGVERLRERVAAMTVHAAAGETVRTSVSAGLTEHHAGESIDQALSRAQAALREAKTQGRNRVVVAKGRSAQPHVTPTGANGGAGLLGTLGRVLRNAKELEMTQQHKPKWLIGTVLGMLVWMALSSLKCNTWPS